MRVLAAGLLGAEAEQFFGTAVPRLDSGAEAPNEDGIGGRVEQRAVASH
jgi:hypothetical protein